MESKVARDGYIHRVIEIITARGAVPASVRFHYWTTPIESMLSGKSDTNTFSQRFAGFFSGGRVPRLVELVYDDDTIEISEYEAVMISRSL